MKKYIFLFVMIFAFAPLAAAYPAPSAAAANGLGAAPDVVQEPELFRLVRAGNLDDVKRFFNQKTTQRLFDSQGWPYYPVLLQRDSHGNNVLHMAPNKEMFYFLSGIAYKLREPLQSQKNNAGETPWMAMISYEKARMFITYFPFSDLKHRMEETKKELKSSGVNLMVAEIKRDALVKECSAGGQTMWQRADALWRMAPERSREKMEMKAVRDMLAHSAPFLVH